MLCCFLPFLGRKNRRELLLRYQVKEERAPAALRLRGAGGGSPQINSPRQRAHRWLQWPPPGARECARGPPRGKAPSKARYIIRAGPTGPGPLQGRVAWPHQGGASDKPRAAAGALPDRACAPGAAIGHRLRDNARAASPPRQRRGLPLHCAAGCASGNPARRPIGRRRRWRGRGAQRAASKQLAGWRAGRAVRDPRAGVPCGSVPRLQRGHGAARRDDEHPPRGAPKGQQARKVRPLARASAATQGRANAARIANRE